MNCYLIVAYRFGTLNAHSYFVGCYTDKDEACRLARNERDDRGGKYGVAVYEFNGMDNSICEYVPSSRGESNPTESGAIRAAKSFGMKYVPLLESGKEVTILEMARFASKESELQSSIAKIMNSSGITQVAPGSGTAGRKINTATGEAQDGREISR